MPLFGTDGLINHLTLIFGALYSLGGFMFRKLIANDALDMPFSIIGCISCGFISFIVLDTFDIIKLTVGGSLIAWLAGGFLLGQLLPDGYSENSSNSR